MEFHIANMSCSGCARTVTGVIKTLDPRADIKADIASRMIEVATSSTRAEIEAALARANYPAHFIAGAREGA